MQALMKIYQRQRECLESDSQGDIAKLKQTLQSLWQVWHVFTTFKMINCLHMYTLNILNHLSTGYSRSC